MRWPCDPWTNVQLGLRLPIVAVLEHVADDADDFGGDARVLPHELWKHEAGRLRHGQVLAHEVLVDDVASAPARDPCRGRTVRPSDAGRWLRRSRESRSRRRARPSVGLPPLADSGSVKRITAVFLMSGIMPLAPAVATPGIARRRSRACSMSWSVLSPPSSGSSTAGDQHAIGRVAGVDRDEPDKTAGQQAGADDQDDGQGCLGDEQSVAQAARVAATEAGAADSDRRPAGVGQIDHVRRAPQARGRCQAGEPGVSRQSSTTGPSIATPSSRGSVGGATTRTRWTSHHASIRPSAPPAMTMTALSVNSCRTMRTRLPPTAVRMASSRCRATPCDRIRPRR